MTTRDLAVAAAGAAVAAAVTLWLSRSQRSTGGRSQRSHTGGGAVEPVLCFGDSLTEGYFNIWQHPIFGPDNPDDPAQEMTRLRLHPYSIRLGARLAEDVADNAAGYASVLRYACCRAYSGWTAKELLPQLRRALGEGPWRACVILAGDNDIIIQGASAATACLRVGALIDECDRAGVRCVVALNPDADLAHNGLVPADEAEQRREAISSLAAALRERCSREGRPCVDLRAVLPLGRDPVEQRRNAELWDDSLHFTPRGSDRVGDAVYEIMRKHSL